MVGKYVLARSLIGGLLEAGGDRLGVERLPEWNS
jgi:hypothetical protein